MCAIEAGKRGRRVAVLDHGDRPGKKILISGGGRCNFTNLHCRPENFLSANPHFARSALARFTPQDFLALVEKHNIPYHEKTLGQLFCDGSAKEILAMLLAECAEAGVAIFLNQHIQRVEKEEVFLVNTKASGFLAPALVIATGGLSIPKMGATSLGYQIAEQFGIAIQECRPALVPFLLEQSDQQDWCDLAGLSAEVIASTGRQQFREKLLITHRGLSGPAILQLSSYWKESEAISVDWAPEKPALTSLLATNTRRDANAAKATLRETFPARLADRLVDLATPSRWTNAAIQQLENRLHHWPFDPDGTEGYDKAEVTAGGVDTAELSAKTMESKRIPGLFFIGEVVDVTGQLGGFNFQWAWASGAAAGRCL
ncbi:NAD(P)/FAD-dependent oxidoreductase [Acidisarcina polymorpha]|nr:NAD(P)/FAD-dependent oxidoreductase [Acidisarcina polymorpha]